MYLIITPDGKMTLDNGEHRDYNNDQIILNIDGDATHYHGRYVTYHARCYTAMLDHYLSDPTFTQTLERV
nr:MAG TPA: hypothetical protein [Caudoviricetes sp.]